jgi:hypothetical protein
MLPLLSTWLPAALAVIGLILGHAGAASAAWLTVRNDTRQSVVVQETVVVNGQVKRGKPATLLPGESLREYVPAPTAKRIEVLDSRNPRQLLWSGNLSCAGETQAYSVATGGGRVVVRPVEDPR